MGRCCTHQIRFATEHTKGAEFEICKYHKYEAALLKNLTKTKLLSLVYSNDLYMAINITGRRTRMIISRSVFGHHFTVKVLHNSCHKDRRCQACPVGLAVVYQDLSMLFP